MTWKKTFTSQHTFSYFGVDFSARLEHLAVYLLTNVNANKVQSQSQYEEILPPSTQDQSLQRTKKEEKKQTKKKQH